jgi:hypothetical protein
MYPPPHMTLDVLSVNSLVLLVNLRCSSFRQRVAEYGETLRFWPGGNHTDWVRELATPAVCVGGCWWRLEGRVWVGVWGEGVWEDWCLLMGCFVWV